MDVKALMREAALYIEHCRGWVPTPLASEGASLVSRLKAAAPTDDQLRGALQAISNIMFWHALEGNARRKYIAPDHKRLFGQILTDLRTAAFVEAVTAGQVKVTR